MFTSTAEEGIKVKANGDPVSDWNCVPENFFELTTSFKMSSTQCEKRCAYHKDCKSCLKGTGAEGGWSECRWSTQLNEVRYARKYHKVNIL